MLALLGSLLGFLGSSVPELFKVFQDKRDKAHELAIIAKQAEINKEAKIITADYKFDIEALKTSVEQTKTGYKVVDILNGLVRPTIAFGFFIAYVVIKFGLYTAVPDNVPFVVVAETLWTEEDTAIFAGIISFYFGNRAMVKRMG